MVHTLLIPHTHPVVWPPPHQPQIAKLLIIPFVCFIESSFLGRTFSREVVSSILLVCTGVAVVTGGCLVGGWMPWVGGGCG